MESVNYIYPTHSHDLYVCKDELITLFRIEGENYDKQHAVQHQDLIGKWYDCSLEYVFDYVKKNKDVEGLKLKVIHVPKSEIHKLRVKNHPIAKDCDHEDTNYIIESNDYIYDEYDLSEYKSIPKNIFHPNYSAFKEKFLTHFSNV